jgi:hypothetical protein
MTAYHVAIAALDQAREALESLADYVAESAERRLGVGPGDEQARQDADYLAAAAPLEELARVRKTVDALRTVAARTTREHAAHQARTEAAMDAGELIEARQAAALRALAVSAGKRANAQAADRDATDRTRQAAVWARAVGVPGRRVAEVGRLAPATVADWSGESRSVARRGVDLGAEGRIRRAYWVLARAPQDWVSLDALRVHLWDVDAAAVDAAFAEMARMEDVHLVPQADQKNLTAEARAAAVYIGGTDHHMIALEAR